MNNVRAPRPLIDGQEILLEHWLRAMIALCVCERTELREGLTAATDVIPSAS